MNRHPILLVLAEIMIVLGLNFGPAILCTFGSI